MHARRIPATTWPCPVGRRPLLADNELITFTGVARAPNVSQWLIDVNGRARAHRSRPRPPKPCRCQRRLRRRDRPTGVESRTTAAAEDNRRLRGEVKRLKAAGRRNLGQQLDQFGAADLGTRVDELTTCNEQLQNELETAQALIADLTGQLNQVDDDLAPHAPASAS